MDFLLQLGVLNLQNILFLVLSARTEQSNKQVRGDICFCNTYSCLEDTFLFHCDFLTQISLQLLLVDLNFLLETLHQTVFKLILAHV